MQPLRFAIFGAGFWARYQLAAWKEIEQVECVALYNRTRSKAESLAAQFQIPRVYHNAGALLAEEQLDFVDIITDVNTHAPFVQLAAQQGLPVICQKPMAPSYEVAQEMAKLCARLQVPLSIHENWRWQHPLRALHQELLSGCIGPVFRARLDYCNSFPVFDNQPFLKELEQFILTDIGSHILDVARFLFGDARTVYCQTCQVHPAIRGEDVATVSLQMQSGVTVTCNMSYASRVEHDRFPETYAFIEGSRGSLQLGPDFWIRRTTGEGTFARRIPPRYYPWADPRYALVHASIVDCHRDLVAGLRHEKTAETSAADNLKTMELVFASYESARRNQVLTLKTSS